MNTFKRPDLLAIWVGWLIGGTICGFLLDISAQQQILDALHVAMVLGCVAVVLT